MSAVEAPPAAERRAWTRPRDPWTTVVAAAIALVAVQLVLRGVIAGQGWFHLDDLVFIHRARTQPFDLGYLLREHAGHLMPGSFALVSLLTAVFPPHWGVVAGVDLAEQLLVDVALFRLLVELFGRRRAILLPFAVFTTTAVTLPATIWWPAALNQLPMQLATLLALTAHVRYLRSGRPRHAVLAALSVLGGLLFSEKTLLAVPLLVVVTLLWFGEGGPLLRLRTLARRHRTGWVLLGGLTVAYVAFYSATVTSPLRALPDPAALPGQVGAVLVRSLLPGLLGGPWVWRPFPVTLPTADPPAALVVLAVLVAVLVVAASLARHGGAGRAWLLLLGWVAVDVVLLAVSRGQVFDTEVLLREYRYLTDAAMIAALVLGLAFLPIRAAPAVLHRRSVRMPAAVTAPAAGTAVVAVLVLGSLASGAGYAAGWRDNPARDFAAAAQAGGEAGPLIDTPVPDRVIWGLLAPENTASVVLSGTPSPPEFLGDGQATGRPLVLDDSGRVVPARVLPAQTGVPGPDGPCGWAVTGRPVTVPLRAALPDGRWLVRVGYLSAEDHAVWLDAGRQRVPALLPAGLHTVVLQVDGPVTGVTVTVLNPAQRFCVGLVEAGVPRPEGG